MDVTIEEYLGILYHTTPNARITLKAYPRFRGSGLEIVAEAGEEDGKGPTAGDALRALQSALDRDAQETQGGDGRE